jgi:hypothetical protein
VAVVYLEYGDRNVPKKKKSESTQPNRKGGCTAQAVDTVYIHTYSERHMRAEKKLKKNLGKKLNEKVSYHIA